MNIGHSFITALKLSVGICFFFITINLSAHNYSLLGSSIKHFSRNGIDLLTSPARWDKSDWIVLGASTVLTTSSVFFFDEPVYRFFESHQNQFIKKSISFFNYSDLYYSIPIVAGFSVAGLVTQNNYTVETGLMLAEACFYSAILTRTVKTIAGRYRPEHELGSNPLKWNTFSGQHSFFSGHTSMAFALASVISWRYRSARWVSWVSYGFASVIGVQRMYYSRHWFSDVLAGAVSATAIGLFIAKNDKQNPLKVYPVLSSQVTGLSIVIPIR